MRLVACLAEGLLGVARRREPSVNASTTGLSYYGDYPCCGDSSTLWTRLLFISGVSRFRAAGVLGGFVASVVV